MNCFLEEQSCRRSEPKKTFLYRFRKNTPSKRPLSGRFQRSDRRPIERTHNFTWGNSVRLLPYLSPFGGQRGCPISSVSFSFQRRYSSAVGSSSSSSSAERHHHGEAAAVDTSYLLLITSLSASATRRAIALKPQINNHGKLRRRRHHGEPK